MTMMRDTEGNILPNGVGALDHDNCWHINLWGDGNLAMSIPMYFDTGGGEYNGSGVIDVPLRDVLQEYLENFKLLDDGEGLSPLAAMFREFAEKYEAAAVADNANLHKQD